MTPVEKVLWSDIEQRYPNMWAFVQNVKKNKDGDIVSVRLLAICTKQDKVKWLKQFTDANIEFQCIRTTFSAPNVGALL